MTRVAFDEKNTRWVDLQGLRGDIHIAPDTRCYYYHLPDTDFVLKGFDSDMISEKKGLGEIVTRDGDFVNTIPFFECSLLCRENTKYKCHILWVQGYENGQISLVINCSEIGDFRVTINLEKMEYSEPDFNVK